MKAIDTSVKTTGQIATIKGSGAQAVGVYLRSDRCTEGMLNEIHSAGLKVWSVWEKGFPIADQYFSSAKGTSDATAAVGFAQSVGQPQGTQIFAAVDYDASLTAINGQINDYQSAFQAVIMAAGYVASVYGSGRTCRILIANGLAKSGWLAQSTGFAEYKAFKPSASIIQLERITSNWDLDEVQNTGDPSLLW